MSSFIDQQPSSLWSVLEIHVQQLQLFLKQYSTGCIWGSDDKTTSSSSTLLTSEKRTLDMHLGEGYFPSIHLLCVILSIAAVLHATGRKVFFWDQDPVLFLCRCTEPEFNGPWSKNKTKQVWVCCCILKGLCTEECVWAALVAVLVSKDLRLYIVYIV